MLAIKIEITKFIDSHQPGFVECRLFDAWNNEFTFRDKVPIFTSEDLNEKSNYPKPGIIACFKIKESIDESNQKIITVNTIKPWDVESLDGIQEFEIFENQLIEI